MKTKVLLGLACVLLVFTFFACTASGSDEATAEKEGVVKISFAVESEDASEKSIGVDNPDLTSNLTYQYKAVANFKLSDGSTPVGSTGDVWTDIKDEMSFSVGNYWTFDVRIIQKGAKYDTDKDDFIVIYQTEAPVNAAITPTSAKYVTFTVKKIVEGTGIVHFNIAATNAEEGTLEVHLYGVPGGERAGDKILGKYDEKAKKLYFVKDLKVASGFYRMTLVYNDGFEKHDYYEDLIEVSHGKETAVYGDFEVVAQGDPNDEPLVAPFFGSNGNKELSGEVRLEKTSFTAKEGVTLSIKYKIENLIEKKKEVLKEAAKKVDLNAEKKNAVEEKKVKIDPNQQKEKVELKPIQQLVKEGVDFTFYVDQKEFKDFTSKGSQYTLNLKPGEYTLGVKATSTLDKNLVAKIDVIKIKVTE